MTANQLNYLNIALMILSCVVAFIVPFELFLFSYAVLGPLHYLTEISWLHKRQYFTPGKKDFMLLGALTILISFPNVFPHFYLMLGPKDTEGHTIITQELDQFLVNASAAVPAFIFIAFASAALMVLTKETKKRVLGFILIVVVAYLFHAQKFMIIAFSLFLPTLVHVYLFTGAFILVGALKSKSTSGILSLVVFVACGVSMFVLFPHTMMAPTAYGMKNYDATFFNFNQQLFDTFVQKSATKEMVYQSSFNIMLTRFIAFAYTYHYLNWFSKTQVIKWHLVPRKSLATVIVIWLLSLVIYFIDYKTGIMALYFLSFLHVIFELPLNFRSFKDIGTSIGAKFMPARK